MSKYDFLEQLRDYLSGQLSESIIQNHVDYYRNYIEAEVRGGRTESEVLSELGDARLLGKTIIDAGQATGYAGYSSESFTQSTNTSDNSTSGQKKKTSNKNSFLHKAKILLVIALIIAVLFFIVRFAVRLLLYILPVIVILAIISYFVKRR